MQKLIRWFEIPVRDMERAVGFYSAVFRTDFSMQQFDGVRHGIFVSRYGGYEISGALVEVDSPVTEHHSTVLYFDAGGDMSAMLERIRENGGEILLNKTLIKDENPDGTRRISKTFIDNESGYIARFRDTEGNEGGLYANS